MKKDDPLRILSETNKIFTPLSETTVFINYSYELETLEVEFSGGKIYHYKNVEPVVWEEYKHEIQTGGSSGIFINTKIKPFYDVVEIE